MRSLRSLAGSGIAVGIVLVIVVVTVTVTATVTASARAAGPAPPLRMITTDSYHELREAFDAQAGSTRVLALLSPT